MSGRAQRLWVRCCITYIVVYAVLSVRSGSSMPTEGGSPETHYRTVFTDSDPIPEGIRLFKDRFDFGTFATCSEAVQQGYLEVDHGPEQDNLVLSPEFIPTNESMMAILPATARKFRISAPADAQKIVEPVGFSRIYFGVYMLPQELFSSIHDQRQVNSSFEVLLHAVPSRRDPKRTFNYRLVFPTTAMITSNPFGFKPLTITDDGSPVEIPMGTVWEAPIVINTEISTPTPIVVQMINAYGNLYIMAPDGNDQLSVHAGYSWSIPQGHPGHILGRAHFSSSHTAETVTAFVMLGTNLGRFCLLVNVKTVPAKPQVLSLGIITDPIAVVSVPITVTNADPGTPMQVKDTYVVQGKSVTPARRNRCFVVTYADPSTPGIDAGQENNRQQALLHKLPPISPLTQSRVAMVTVDSEECRLAYGAAAFGKPLTLNATLVVRTNGTSATAFPRRFLFTISGTWLLDLLRTPHFQPLKAVGGGSTPAANPFVGDGRIGVALLHRHDDDPKGNSAASVQMLKWGKGIPDSFAELLIPCKLQASGVQILKIAPSVPWLVRSGIETGHRVKTGSGQSAELEAFSLGLWGYNNSLLPRAEQFVGDTALGPRSPFALAHVQVTLSFINEASAHKERGQAEVQVPVLVAAAPLFITYSRVPAKEGGKHQRVEAFHEASASKKGGHFSDSAWSIEVEAAPFVHRKQRSSFLDRTHRAYVANLGVVSLPSPFKVLGKGERWPEYPMGPKLLKSEDFEFHNPHNATVVLHGFILDKTLAFGGSSARSVHIEVVCLAQNDRGKEETDILTTTSIGKKVSVAAGEVVSVRVKLLATNKMEFQAEGVVLGALHFNATIDFPARRVRMATAWPITVTISRGNISLSAEKAPLVVGSNFTDRYQQTTVSLSSTMGNSFRLSDAYVSGIRSPKTFLHHSSLLQAFQVTHLERDLPSRAQNARLATVVFDSHFAHNCRRELKVLAYLGSRDQQRVSERCREEEDSAPPGAVEQLRGVNRASTILPVEEIQDFGDLPGKMQRPKSRFNVVFGPKAQWHTELHHQNSIPSYGPGVLDFGSFAAPEDEVRVVYRYIPVTNPTSHPLKAQLLLFGDTTLEHWGALCKSTESLQTLRSTLRHFIGKDVSSILTKCDKVPTAVFKLKPNGTIPVVVPPGSTSLLGPIELHVGTSFWNEAIASSAAKSDTSKPGSATPRAQFATAVLLRNNDTGLELVELNAAEGTEVIPSITHASPATASAADTSNKVSDTTSLIPAGAVVMPTTSVLPTEFSPIDEGFAGTWPSLGQTYTALTSAFHDGGVTSAMEKVITSSLRPPKSSMSRFLALSNDGPQRVALTDFTLGGVQCGSFARVQMDLDPCPGADEFVLSPGQTRSLKLRILPNHRTAHITTALHLSARTLSDDKVTTWVYPISVTFPPSMTDVNTRPKSLAETFWYWNLFAVSCALALHMLLATKGQGIWSSSTYIVDDTGVAEISIGEAPTSKSGPTVTSSTTVGKKRGPLPTATKKNSKPEKKTPSSKKNALPPKQPSSGKVPKNTKPNESGGSATEREEGGSSSVGRSQTPTPVATPHPNEEEEEYAEQEEMEEGMEEEEVESQVDEEPSPIDWDSLLAQVEEESEDERESVSQSEATQFEQMANRMLVVLAELREAEEVQHAKRLQLEKANAQATSTSAAVERLDQEPSPIDWESLLAQVQEESEDERESVSQSEATQFERMVNRMFVVLAELREAEEVQHAKRLQLEKAKAQAARASAAVERSPTPPLGSPEAIGDGGSSGKSHTPIAPMSVDSPVTMGSSGDPAAFGSMSRSNPPSALTTPGHGSGPPPATAAASLATAAVTTAPKPKKEKKPKAGAVEKGVWERTLADLAPPMLGTMEQPPPPAGSRPPLVLTLGGESNSSPTPIVGAPGPVLMPPLHDELPSTTSASVDLSQLLSELRSDAPLADPQDAVSKTAPSAPGDPFAKEEKEEDGSTGGAGRFFSW